MKLYSLKNEFIKESYSLPWKFTGILEYNNGNRWWYLEGTVHRLDGPATTWPDGTKYWYINGKDVTEEQCKLLYDIMKLKELL